MGHNVESAKNRIGGQVAGERDPTSASEWYVTRLVGYPGFAYGLTSDLGGTIRETSMAGS